MSQPPIPILPKYWTRAEDRSRAVNTMFDRSAADYDWICSVSSFGAGQKYRRDALVRAGLRPGMRVLDVGTGTGLVAREAAPIVGASGRIVGIDPSSQMLREGRRHVAMPVVRGVGERLPFAGASFDFLVMGYALRHVPDLDEAFGEYRRVLRPGGRVLLLEITRPQSRLGFGLARLYFNGVVPFIARFGSRRADTARLMKFYWDTIALCVPPDTVLAALGRAGFHALNRQLIHGIFSEYTGTKNRESGI